MKHSAYPQYATVRETIGTLFDAKLNETIRELRDKNPVVTFSDADPLCAYVAYTITEDRPETIEEASAIEGVRFVCEQCPYFKPIEKEDGDPDRRHKWGNCPYTDSGRAKKTAPACDRLYDLVKGGGVRICLSDSE